LRLVGENTISEMYTEVEVAELNSKFKGRSPDEILRWAVDNLHPRVALATSFQAQGVVLIDMILKINSEARIFTLDTGRLFQESYDIIDVIRTKYNAKIELLFPDLKEVEEMVNEKGVNLFYKGVENRLLCCGIRKVLPLERMLKTLDGWVTSIRRDQTENRANTSIFEIDNSHRGILKINPLINWSSKQVWDYIEQYNVPYNKLHDKGFLSIGCAPCTRPVKPGEDPRAGRWWWESDTDKECGLHFDNGDNE